MNLPRIDHNSLPRSRFWRIVIGLFLLIGGILGFLPVLGFWMIPLGLIVLAIDIPMIRRFSHRIGLRVREHREHREARQAALEEGDPEES